ncbi:MAG: NfeD family protein [Planctomycetota bacterium]|nr:NfeD family protein [Planctomycetota bacterium]
MLDPLVWAGLLLILGLALVLAEVFIPSGGVIGVFSLTAVIASIAIAFIQRGPLAGLIFLAISLVAIPIVLALAFRWLPSTPVGKLLLADVPTSEDVLPDSPELRRLRELVGKVGRAQSMMLPSGAIEIEGMTVDAVSEGMPIDLGQAVQVTAVNGSLVQVRPVSENRLPKPKNDDPLSQSIESLGIDPFEDPLL